jgi:hypothetical protein
MKLVNTSIRSILLAALFVASTKLFAAEAAKVEFVWGSAFTLTASGEKRELTKGLGIEVGETVISEDARVQLRFTDGGFVSLAPNSEFRVNAYSYSGTPDGSERIEMELLKGGLRTISGLIGKAIKTAYEMKTAVATMGIRGTEYTVVYGDGVTGTVSAGAIAVCNAGGCIDVPLGQSYKVVDISTRPVLISKAAILPPPPTVNHEQEKVDQTDIDNLAASSEGESSDRGNNPTNMSGVGRGKYTDEGIGKGTHYIHQLTREDAEGTAFARSSNGAEFITVPTQKPKEAFKAFESETSSRSLRLNDSGDSILRNGGSTDKIKIK